MFSLIITVKAPKKGNEKSVKFAGSNMSGNRQKDSGIFHNNILIAAKKKRKLSASSKERRNKKKLVSEDESICTTSSRSESDDESICTTSSRSESSYSLASSDSDIWDTDSVKSIDTTSSYEIYDAPPKNFNKTRKAYWDKVNKLAYIKLDWNDDGEEVSKLCRILCVAANQDDFTSTVAERLCFKFAPENEKQTFSNTECAACAEMVDCDWVKWL